MLRRHRHRGGRRRLCRRRRLIRFREPRQRQVRSAVGSRHRRRPALGAAHGEVRVRPRSGCDRRRWALRWRLPVHEIDLEACAEEPWRQLLPDLARRPGQPARGARGTNNNHRTRIHLDPAGRNVQALRGPASSAPSSGRFATVRSGGPCQTSRTMRVLAISHERDAGPGVFAEAIRAPAARLDVWHRAETDDLPGSRTLRRRDHLRRRDARRPGRPHPWITEESPSWRGCSPPGAAARRLSRRAAARARRRGRGAAGARARDRLARRAAHGGRRGRPAPLHLAPGFEAYEWHSYECLPPPRATTLAASDACVQAFRIGESCLGDPVSRRGHRRRRPRLDPRLRHHRSGRGPPRARPGALRVKRASGSRPGTTSAVASAAASWRRPSATRRSPGKVRRRVSACPHPFDERRPPLLLVRARLEPGGDLVPAAPHLRRGLARFGGLPVLGGDPAAADLDVDHLVRPVEILEGRDQRISVLAHDLELEALPVSAGMRLCSIPHRRRWASRGSNSELSASTALIGTGNA